MKLVLIDDDFQEDVTSVTITPTGLNIQGETRSMESPVTNPDCVDCEGAHAWSIWKQYVLESVKYDGKLWHTQRIPMQLRHCRTCNFEQREMIHGEKP